MPDLGRDPGCECKHPLNTVAPMDAITHAGSGAALLWSRRAVDLCRVAACLCRMS
jgi:hypothetical protein